jgi:hypothetical protein
MNRTCPEISDKDGMPARTTTRNRSGLKITTVSPTGVRAARSSNLTVTEMAGWPGTSRRPRAIDGCGGMNSRSAAPAYAKAAAAGPPEIEWSIASKESRSSPASNSATACGT